MFAFAVALCINGPLELRRKLTAEYQDATRNVIPGHHAEHNKYPTSMLGTCAILISVIFLKKKNIRKQERFESKSYTMK